MEEEEEVMDVLNRNLPEFKWPSNVVEILPVDPNRPPTPPPEPPKKQKDQVDGILDPLKKLTKTYRDYKNRLNTAPYDLDGKTKQKSKDEKKDEKKKTPKKFEPRKNYSNFLLANSDSQLRIPMRSTIILSGVTGSGKTIFLKNVFSQQYWSFTEDVVKVYVIAKVSTQNSYAVLNNFLERYNIPVEFYDTIKNLPELLETIESNSVLIIDDFMVDASKDKNLMQTMTNVFNVDSHHRHIITIVTLHNIFYDGFRTVRLNSNFLFLFRSPIDLNSALQFFRQLDPDKYRSLYEAYKISINNQTEENNRFMAIHANYNSGLNKDYFAGFKVKLLLLND